MSKLEIINTMPDSTKVVRVKLGEDNLPPQVVLEAKLVSQRVMKFREPRDTCEVAIQYDGTEGLVFRDGTPDGFLSFLDGTTTQDVDINHDFTVYLNPDRLIDYEAGSETSLQNESVTTEIHFNIIVTNSKRKSLTFQFIQKIEIPVVVPLLNAEIELEKTEVEWFDVENPDTNRDVKIGGLKFWHGRLQTCSPEINVDPLSITIKQEGSRLPDTDEPGTISLDIKEIKETNTKVPLTADNINITRSKLSCLNVDPQDRSKYKITKLCVNPDESGKPNEVSIPMVWTLPSKNPMQDIMDLVIEARFQCWYIVNKDGFELKNSFETSYRKKLTLKRNKKFVELEVRGGLNSNMPIIGNGKIINVENPIFASDDQNVGYDFAIDVCNRAEAPSEKGASIIIDGFMLLPMKYKTDDATAWQESDASDLYTEHQGSGGTSLTDGMISLGYSCPVRRYRKSVRVALADLKRLLENVGTRHAVLSLPFSFRYLLDINGSVADKVKQEDWESIRNQRKNDFETFTGSIEFRTSLQPDPNWVSIDFGTSAVVAAMGSGPNVLEVIDLKQRKIDMLRTLYGTETTAKIGEEEPNKIISSTICFNQGNSVGFDDTLEDEASYIGLPLWFSPSPGMMEQPDYLLPCLKYLAATDELPRGAYFKDDFSYKDSNGKTYQGLAESVNGRTDYIGLGKMENIFKSVYHQLFKLFISPSLRRSCNLMVLTLPNTFTPLHEERLRELVQDVFPDVWPEFLTFVSESDAVACYYMYYRGEFYKNSRETLVSTEQLEKEERVLVYDMGAGTLDLTYVVRSDDGSKQTLSVEGKMGISKAGDYLDYVLAEILVDLLEQKGSVKAKVLKKYLELDLNKRLGLGADADVRLVKSFKDYIKKQLKPLLNDDSAVLPDYMLLDNIDTSNPFVDLKISDLKSSDKYKAFIHSCTFEVLDTFEQLFGKNQNEVDVVVFSGRSALLNDIRTGVADYFPDTTLYADIQTKRLLSKSEVGRQNDADVDEMKKIVAKGAIAAASMRQSTAFNLVERGVYASYGAIVYSRLSSTDVRWFPLYDIKHHKLKEADSFGIRYDSNETQINPINLNSSQIGRIVFTQCYSADPQKDIDNGDFSKMTHLYEYKVPTVGEPFSISLSLLIDKNYNLTFKIGEMKMDTRAKLDFNDLGFRKSLWPVLLTD